MNIGIVLDAACATLALGALIAAFVTCDPCGGGAASARPWNPALRRCGARPN